MEKLVLSPGIWYYVGDIRGIYTVKVAYKKLCGEHSMQQINGGFSHWNQLWNLKLPPKFKVFCWRAVLGILPTCFNIKGRGVEVDTHCPTCPMGDETTFHDLVGCSQINHAWQPVGLVDSIQPEMEFGLSLENTFISQPRDVICRVVFLMYHIWHARNTLVWEEKAASSFDILRIAERNLVDWNALGSASPSQHTSPAMHCPNAC